MRHSVLSLIIVTIIIGMVLLGVIIIGFYQCGPKIHDRYEKSPGYTQNIEKNIFQTYPTHNVPPEFLRLVTHLKKQNPEYNHRIFDDEEMDSFVQSEYPRYYESFSRISPKYGVAKADFFRYMVVYHYGGVYFDIKSGCLVPLRDIIHPEDSFVVTKWRVLPLSPTIPNEHAQWCIIAKKNSPYLKAVLEEVHQRILSYDSEVDGVGKPGVLRLTGPKMFNYVVDKQERINGYPITKYRSNMNGKLVYSYMNKRLVNVGLCGLFELTKGSIGSCNHSQGKGERYEEQTTPIVLPSQ